MSSQTIDPTHADLEQVDLSDPELYANGIPHALFARMRREAPVRWNPMRDEPGFWAVTRHEDIAAIGRDPETFSSYVGATRIRDDAVISVDIAHYQMINMDPPRHTTYRAHIDPAAAHRRVAELEPHLREVARERIEAALSKGELDLVADVAAPLPYAAMARLFGIADADLPRVIEWTERIAGFDEALIRENGTDVLIEAAEYLIQLVAEHRARPQDDLLSDIMAFEVDGELLTDVEVIAFLIGVTVAGHDVTPAVFSGGMLALMEHPDQRQALEDDPGLVPAAVDEMVRWVSPINYYRRTATRDTEVRGVPIREGEKVVLWYASGNRDEDVFEDPDRFDIRRDPNPHQGFGGGGQHSCLGAGLARLQLRVLLEESMRLMPRLELAGAPVRVRSSFASSLAELPVRAA